ncbi:MAG TPA: hypothetical protein VLU95_06690 [Candidatus Acidoferrum sp.]|nr:hypothetical protein [Candidatus Acidoferrum sp.]
MLSDCIIFLGLKLIDAITLLLYMFLGFVFVMIILIGITFLKALFGIHPATGTQTSSKTPEREEDDTEKDIREDSEGDGLVMFDDPMFPPEFDDDDDM